MVAAARHRHKGSDRLRTDARDVIGADFSSLHDGQTLLRISKQGESLLNFMDYILITDFVA